MTNATWRKNRPGLRQGLPPKQWDKSVHHLMKQSNRQVKLMVRISYFVLAVILCLSLSVSWTGYGVAKDQVAPEQVAASHLNAIGSPAALAALKTLTFVGTTSVDFIQGMYGNMSGTSMCVSDGKKLGIVLKYSDINYPGEYFAYNGKDVSVGYMSPGQKSPLADFLFRYNGIMKEGLLGGVFSTGWPLLNLQEKQALLIYKETTIDGRRLHELEYRPKQGLGDMKIKLYFDQETYRHVRTEYRLRIRDDMTASPGGYGTRTGKFQSPGGDTSASGFDTLSQGLPDSIYVLTEKFDDFKKVGAMTLPHLYTLDFSVEGQGHAFIAKWTMKPAQWAFNRAVDERLFIAQK
jgi:hypothetical protein